MSAPTFTGDDYGAQRIIFSDSFALPPGYIRDDGALETGQPDIAALVAEVGPFGLDPVAFDPSGANSGTLRTHSWDWTRLPTYADLLHYLKTREL